MDLTFEAEPEPTEPRPTEPEVSNPVVTNPAPSGSSFANLLRRPFGRWF